MVTLFFAHGPTVLTNRVRYDTKRHFLKIFFVVYSITMSCQAKIGNIAKNLVESIALANNNNNNWYSVAVLCITSIKTIE